MDTPRYRIGNDLTIFWAINNRDGSPYDLDGKEVRLFMTHERGREEVEVQITQLEPGIRNNVIRWDFKAEDQRILGKYTLTFVVLESDTHRELTKDYGEAFTLVGRSEMENEEGDANISTGGDLILSTKLDVYRIQATNVDVAGLKNQIYDVEKGLTTKVERKEFDEKTGEFENAFVKVETSIKGINTEIKDASGEITQIKQSIDGIEVSVGDLEYKVESLEKQTDGAIEKWFYPGPPSAETLPESNWKTEQEKYSHLGDLYYDETTGLAYRYSVKDKVYYWALVQDADIVAALEAAKNNNKTFIDQPKTPYKVGDLWIAEKDYEEAGIKQDDIIVCITAREEGEFEITDWQKKGNAIDDKDLEEFVNKYYEENILPEISKQLDGQASSYYGPDDPSLEWEEGTEADHKGDLWFNTTNNQAYYWSGSEWVESEVPEEVFDKIDGKNAIYVARPEGKDYKENDLWFVEQDYDLQGFKHQRGVILVALEDAVLDEETQTYQFKYTDWARRDTYTDDTAVNELNTYMVGAFKDGMLDESEKQAIAAAWDNIALAQEELNADYLTVILPGYALPEYELLKAAYKSVYNPELTEDFPALGSYQVLEQKVQAVLEYIVTDEASGLSDLLEEYDTAFDAYRLALSNYTTVYAEFTNAIRANLGQANEYIEAITDDGKLTPIEKKQLLEVYRGLAVEYTTNRDSAYNAKIWNTDDSGNEVPGVYAGPKGVGTEYFDVYVAYKEAYTPILSVFTGNDWGFDEDHLNVTTQFEGDLDLSLLKEYFDAYYVALTNMAHVLSVVAEEKAEASLAMKEYMDDLEEVLTPTEAITQVGKGVVLSSIIGVGTYDANTGKYLLKAGMNATSKNADDLITMSAEHGRIVFVGGADGKTDWNQATYVVYEDGYVHFRAGKIDQDVQIGNAIIQSVIADKINLLSWPEYDEATGQTKLTPLFSVNTEKDANGRDRIVSISALYDMYIGGNLVVRGDTSSTAKGTDAGVAGTLLGIKVNGQTYDNPVNGILTIPDYPTSLEWSAINGKPTKLTEFTNDAGFITSAALNGYATQSWVEGKNYLTSHQSIYGLTINNSAGASQVHFNPAQEAKTLTLTKAMVGLGNVENKSSATIRGEITATNVTDALGYTPLSTAGGTIQGANTRPLVINSTSSDKAVELRLQKNGVLKADIGHDDSHGVYIYDAISTRFMGINTDGTPYYHNGSYKDTLIHSGNIGSYAPQFSTNILLSSSSNLVGYTYETGGDTKFPEAGPAMVIGSANGAYKMAFHSRRGVLLFNSMENRALTGWKTIAFTDSNVASATKLQTARTIWGQSFDGTGNVKGGLSAVQNIDFESNNLHDVGNNSRQARYIYAGWFGSKTGESLSFGANNRTHMLITPSGNVLIGTTTDSGYKLDVNGTINATTGYISKYASDAYPRFRIVQEGGVTYMQASNSGSSVSGSWYISGSDTNAAALCHIKANNITLTGAVTMSSTLRVSGQTTINNNLIVAGDTASGSDIRFKDKIADHRIALSDIADAPLFTFTWNDREDKTIHLGSSAQYWEKVAPWLVKGEDFKTLDYSTLGVAIGISLANKAVNHEERIKILEKENKALKEQIRRIQYGQLG